MKSFPRGFTLIELLVVIAIIAILAAILFPVFAQAKAAAKKTAALSNSKQINTANATYLGDWDDHVPIQWYFTGQPDEKGGDNLRRLLVWDGALMPYMKTIEIMRSPNDASNLGGAWIPRFDWGWKSVYPSWGLNLWYLNPADRNADNCASWNGSDPPIFSGAPTVSRTINATEVANPADTVFIAETTALDQSYGVVAGHRAIPPVGGLDPDVCNYNSGGLGQVERLGDLSQGWRRAARTSLGERRVPQHGPEHRRLHGHPLEGDVAGGLGGGNRLVVRREQPREDRGPRQVHLGHQVRRFAPLAILALIAFGCAPKEDTDAMKAPPPGPDAVAPEAQPNASNLSPAGAGGIGAAGSAPATQTTG